MVNDVIVALRPRNGPWPHDIKIENTQGECDDYDALENRARTAEDALGVAIEACVKAEKERDLWKAKADDERKGRLDAEERESQTNEELEEYVIHAAEKAAVLRHCLELASLA